MMGYRYEDDCGQRPRLAKTSLWKRCIPSSQAHRHYYPLFLKNTHVISQVKIGKRMHLSRSFISGSSSALSNALLVGRFLNVPARVALACMNQPSLTLSSTRRSWYDVSAPRFAFPQSACAKCTLKHVTLHLSSFTRFLTCPFQDITTRHIVFLYSRCHLSGAPFRPGIFATLHWIWPKRPDLCPCNTQYSQVRCL